MDKEKDAQDMEGKGTRALRRRRRQEATLMNIDSFKRMQSMELPKV